MASDDAIQSQQARLYELHAEERREALNEYKRELGLRPPWPMTSRANRAVYREKRA